MIDSQKNGLNLTITPAGDDWLSRIPSGPLKLSDCYGHNGLHGRTAGGGISGRRRVSRASVVSSPLFHMKPVCID